jgi:argininosuccinate lyase
MKLWDKEKKTDDAVMKFTVGNDPAFDKLLAPYDVIGSMAHAIMLGKTGLMKQDEAQLILRELADYYPVTRDPDFALEQDDEDIHSHLENHLVKILGEPGKRIHTARSRNDQVMTAMLLFMKEELRLVIADVQTLFDTLVRQAGAFSKYLLPGYTHTQVAMPSSFALWLGAYAESLVNDLQLVSGILKVIDQNPLGSAAGYGSSFPIDRELTTRMAGFSDLQVSSVSAQLNRGKMEMHMATGLSSLANTMSRLAADMILFMSQDLNFISFSDELTTGSSIMPHKKNPDVLELVRAHCNTIMAMPGTLNGLTANMISGYHRDFQLTKEILVPGIGKTRQCLQMMALMCSSMVPRERILEDPKYFLVFSVEEVNKKVMAGTPFRDAYREVAAEIESGAYKPSGNIAYTHTGSIGNPGLEKIVAKMRAVQRGLQITPSEKIFEKLQDYL